MILERGIKNRKTVFIKNPVHETLPLYLAKGSVIMFYIGSPDKCITAEGIIEKIELLNYKETVKQYRNKLIQTKEELLGYCGMGFIGGSNKKLVYYIKKLNFERKKIYPKFPITMTGKYITKKDYEELHMRN